MINSASKRESTYQVPQNVAQAFFARDALAKGIYSKLFDHLVSFINQTMGMREGKFKTIGILDIYGFEIFDYNSFEQLCINYCNESLHQIFIDLTLKTEQEEYNREGIPWEAIKYIDNKPCVELIENVSRFPQINSLFRNLSVSCPYWTKNASSQKEPTFPS